MCTVCLQYNCTVYHRLAIVEPWSRVARESQGWPWQALVQRKPWLALAVLGRRRPKTPKIGFGGGDRSTATIVNQCWPKYSPVQIYHRVYLYSQLCTFCLQYNCTVYHRLAIVEPWSRVARVSQGWPWQALVRHITPSKSYPWCLWPPATKDSQGWPWQSLAQGSQRQPGLAMASPGETYHPLQILSLVSLAAGGQGQPGLAMAIPGPG